MPIKIPNLLPARETLEEEHIFVMTENRALHQDIRPLRIAILNLMPTKIVTETQLLRCLSNTPLQIEIDLLQTSTYTSKNTSEEHLASFYKTFDSVRDRKYDGMIITGAPVEQMDYEQVAYWNEIKEIFEWTKTHVYSTLHVCWGALAGLYYHYGIQKHDLPQKRFGVFEHYLLTPKARLFHGFNDRFLVPHSRHTEVRREDIEQCPQLRLMAASDGAGVHIVGDLSGRQFFVLGHHEYDANTLSLEYFRDKERGLDIQIPVNYFPDDDPTKTPRNTWRAHGTLLYTNWLNYYVYQTTPYDIDMDKFDNNEGELP